MVSLGITILLVGSALRILALARRGPQRLLALRLSVVTMTVGISTIAIWLPQQWGVALADALSFTSLALAVTFGLWSPVFSGKVASVTIGIVIPSRMAFHQEIREAMNKQLASINAVVIDEYAENHRVREDLSDFIPCLRRTYLQKPDYLVICAPLSSQSSDAQLRNCVQDLVRRGGAVFLIESSPILGLTRRTKHRVAEVSSDSVGGASVITEYMKATTAVGERILVVGGPIGAAAADARNALFEAALPDCDISALSSAGWTEEGAFEITQRAFEKSTHTYSAIIAANDTMAFGCVKALRASGRDPLATRVIGYDGIRRALSAIAEPCNPFEATVRIPPGAYGDHIGCEIVRDVGRRRIFAPKIEDMTISIDSSHLVSVRNVSNLLEG